MENKTSNETWNEDLRAALIAIKRANYSAFVTPEEWIKEAARYADAMQEERARRSKEEQTLRGRIKELEDRLQNVSRQRDGLQGGIAVRDKIIEDLNHNYHIKNWLPHPYSSKWPDGSKNFFTINITIEEALKIYNEKE